MEAETPAATQPDAPAQEAQASGSGAEPAAQEASTSSSASDQAPPAPPRVATALPPVQANMMVRRTGAQSCTQAAQRSVATLSTHTFPRALFATTQLGGFRAMGAMQAFYAAKADFEVCLLRLHLHFPLSRQHNGERRLTLNSVVRRA